MVASKSKITLSVIVPAYKQEETIRKDLLQIEKTLKKGLGDDFPYEIICIVDGKLDRTEDEAKKTRSSRIKVFAYKKRIYRSFGKYLMQFD